MAWVSPANTVEGIILEAARARRESLVVQSRDSQRRLDYFTAFNRALQAVGNSRTWWFLNRDCALATKSGQSSYALRSQASATVTFSGAPTAGQAVTVDSTAYTFTATGAASKAAGIEELIDLINAGTQCYAIQTSASTVELYWSGDDGETKTVTENVSNLTVDSTFTLSMPDFSKLMGVRRPGVSRKMIRLNPTDTYWAGISTVSDGEPYAYALTGAEATLRIYSASLGAADGVYPIQVLYNAMPSAVLPDGRGQLDFPVQFHDLFPTMIQLILGMEVYDESAVLGDQIVQRRLVELQNFTPDETADWEGSTNSSGVPSWLINPYCP